MGLESVCVAPRVTSQRCPYDHADLVPGAPRKTCDRCGAWHHPECWLDLGRCGACGWTRQLVIAVQPRARSSEVDDTRVCPDCRRPRSGTGPRRLLVHLEAEHDVTRETVARELDVAASTLRAYEARPDGGLPRAFRERLRAWLDELEDLELEEELELLGEEEEEE